MVRRTRPGISRFRARCGACHRARIRATRWHRSACGGLSPRAGRGDRTRGCFVRKKIPFDFRRAEMTQLRIPAAHLARVLHLACPLRRRRAQGRPGARMHPRAFAQKRLRKGAKTTGTGGITPAFPAQWFTAYFALSLGTGLSCPHHQRDADRIIANLAPASGRQDHTTSPSAIAAARQSAPTRPPHPAPRFVTTRVRPSCRDRMRERIVLICPTRQAKAHAADWHDGQFAHGAHARFACPGESDRLEQPRLDERREIKQPNSGSVHRQAKRNNLLVRLIIGRSIKMARMSQSGVPR
jgi:hypothetical protein